MTFRELTGDITCRALSDVPEGLPLTMRLPRENIARHGLPYVDGGPAFLLPEPDRHAATDGRRLRLQALVYRLELEWFRHGGALPCVLDRLLEAAR